MKVFARLRCPPPQSLVLRQSAVVLACVAGCAHTLRIPVPDGGPGTPPPALSPSSIDVPLSADLRATLAGLESQVPSSFGTDGHFRMVGPSPVGVRYTVHREPFVFTARNGALHAEALLTLQAEACIGAPLGISLPLIGGGCTPVASCGVHEAPRRVVVSTDTTLHIDPSWRIVSQTVPGTPVFQDRCQLTDFHIDVTDLVAAVVSQQIAVATQAMDDGIARHGDLRPRATAFWSGLLQPVDMGEGFWLSLEPQGVHAAPFDLTPDTARTTVGITARPRVSAGTQPPVGTIPLPDVQASTGDASGFHMTIDAMVPFAEATAMIATEFRGRTLTLEGHQALVRDIRVTGSGSALLFAIDVTFASGAFANTQGTVYLSGLPDYDPATGDLVVRAVDYTLETRNVLLRVGEWMLRGSLREDIARHARFPLGARIARLRHNAQGALERTLAPGTVLHGSLRDVRPVGAYVTPDGVVVRVEATGSATVTQDLSTLDLTGAHSPPSSYPGMAPPPGSW